MSSLHRRSKQYTNVYLTVIGLLVAFGFGLFVGGGRFTLHKKTGDFSDKAGVERLLVETRESAREDVPFDLYWDVWDRIDNKFIGGDQEDLDLFYGSIMGLVAGLGDPYSVFLPPRTAEAFVADLSGSFEGIGAEIGIKNGMLTVIAPLPDSPAERAGVLSGDVIMAVDDQETFDMALDEAVGAIRGRRGTNVDLTIRRNGFDTTETITVTRGVIAVSAVEWAMETDLVGYIKVSHFNEETQQRFEQARQQLLAQGAQSIILDLRNNPGGFLETAVQMSSEWLEEDSVVLIEESRTGDKKEYLASAGGQFVGMPTVILVNGGSASASEIVAGALQDHGVATVIGQQTFGKGSVQGFDILPDGSALKLTIAQWLTPKKRQINEVGITPDVVMDEVEQKVNEDDQVEDLFIQKALEQLK